MCGLWLCDWFNIFDISPPLRLSLAAEIDLNCVLKWGLIKLDDRLLIAISSSQRTRQTLLFTFCALWDVHCGINRCSRHRFRIYFHVCVCVCVCGFVCSTSSGPRGFHLHWGVLDVEMRAQALLIPPTSPSTGGKNIIGFPLGMVDMTFWCVTYPIFTQQRFASSHSPSAPSLHVTSAVAVPHDLVAPSGDASCLEFLVY